jgi:hypothetical protein
VSQAYVPIGAEREAQDWVTPLIRPPHREGSCRVFPCSDLPETSNNIIQKGLAFIGDWSGTVVKYARRGRSGILPRRLVGRGGASVVVRRNAAINRMEDSDAKVFKEAFA